MKMLITAGALAAGAALLTSFTPQAGASRAAAVNLKFNFKPGSKFSYTSQTTQSLDVQGNKMAQDLSTASTFAVQARQGTSSDLLLTYGRVTMKMDAAGQQMTYDSDDAASATNPMGAILGGMVGKTLVITVSDQGEVTAVKGVEELKKSILASKESQAFSQQLEQTLSESTIRGSMNQLFNIYPGRAVKPGESWTKQTALTMGPTAMKLASTYTLGSVQNGVAHLQVSGKLSVDGMATLTGTQQGTMDVDVASGLVLGSKLHQSLSSQVSSAPMSVVSDITTTGKKL